MLKREMKEGQKEMPDRLQFFGKLLFVCCLLQSSLGRGPSRFIQFNVTSCYYYKNNNFLAIQCTTSDLIIVVTAPLFFMQYFHNFHNFRFSLFIYTTSHR